ncbi:uncharacterized protein LOC121389647 [Gigantopelta aegis]|uniref:uncharacterized protein LOC121389647 n=1 Tax=Gigantopelta aegis TaxID=1735272 RepID=UPI001B887F00|nr:uncharacterized protein LOC121389647 [Gigantopelta aegis]
MELYRAMSVELLLTVLLTLVSLSSGQFSKKFEGDLEETIDKYRFQYHDATNVLLTIEGDKCYVTNVESGSSLQETLNEVTRRKEYYEHLIPIIKSGVDLTKASLTDIHKQFQDHLLRAMCFRSKIFKLNLDNHV